MTEQKSLPRLNEPAPDFKAKTTFGDKELKDYKGKWLVLFSHPSDFTPVCTTEFMGFALKQPEFEKLNCELLGLSIDSIHSHIAWVRSIKDNFDVEINFPIIADLSMQVAKDYGMIHEGASDTAAVRAVFVIDPESKMRAMLYYPMSNGRSVDEVFRLVQALQTSDEHKVATPENWKPGESCIVPPPHTQKDAEKREGEGYEYTDWYFCKKKVA